MKNKTLALAIAVGAAVVLAGSVSYAVASATDGGHYGSMMNGSGYQMMGANGTRSAWYLNGSGPVRDIAAALAQAQRFADRLGLKTGEVMQFTNNFYVLLTDRQGKPATEVLVDPAAGAVTLEYGPAMMWNTRYGMMSGTATNGPGEMMGGGGMMGINGTGMMGGSGYRGMMGGAGMMGSAGGSPSWTPGNVSGPVTESQARTLADRWLAQHQSGTTAAAPDALPGYFTFHTMKDGKIAGMLSVNARTGAVWFHWWHGRFIAMQE